MKKYNYPEARREIIESGIRLGAGDFIDVQALQVAADALAKLCKQPAMKDHERIFFALCYNLRDGLKPRDVVNLLADTIPHKRCWYYLDKWASLGFYDYGVTLDLGWFYPEKLPPRYQEIVKDAHTVKVEKIPTVSSILTGEVLTDTTDATALLAAAKAALVELDDYWQRKKAGK